MASTFDNLLDCGIPCVFLFGVNLIMSGVYFTSAFNYFVYIDTPSDITKALQWLYTACFLVFLRLSLKQLEIWYKGGYDMVEISGPMQFFIFCLVIVTGAIGLATKTNVEESDDISDLTKKFLDTVNIVSIIIGGMLFFNYFIDKYNDKDYRRRKQQLELRAERKHRQQMDDEVKQYEDDQDFSRNRQRMRTVPKDEPVPADKPVPQTGNRTTLFDKFKRKRAEKAAGAPEAAKAEAPGAAPVPVPAPVADQEEAGALEAQGK